MQSRNDKYIVQNYSLKKIVHTIKEPKRLKLRNGEVQVVRGEYRQRK